MNTRCVTSAGLLFIMDVRDRQCYFEINYDDLLSEKFFVLKVSFFNIILAKDERKQLTFSLLNLVNRFMYMIVKHALSLFRHVYKCLLMKCSMSQHITWLKFYIILFIFCDKNCWLDLCFPSSSSLNGDLWLSVNIEEKNISFSTWCHRVTWHFLFGWQKNRLSDLSHPEDQLLTCYNLFHSSTIIKKFWSEKYWNVTCDIFKIFSFDR